MALALVGLFLAGGSAVGQATQALAYVPALPEMIDLIGTNMPGYLIQPAGARAPAWDVSADYFLSRRNRSAEYELFVAASVFDSPAEAAAFFRVRAAEMEADNERTAITDDPGLAGRYHLDDLRDYQLIYVGPSSGQRVGNSARLARLGRSVAMVQAIGSPEADDQGVVDNDRGLALVRTFELVVGRLLWYPSDSARAVPGLDPFARDWSRHGFAMTIDPTGHGETSWRVYRWCQDDPTPPCDETVGNQIIAGGWASVQFYHVDEQTAEGVVIGSAMPDVLALGPVTLTLEPYGMARLEQAGQPIDLCGPDYLELAPEFVRRQAPCGA